MGQTTGSEPSNAGQDAGVLPEVYSELRRMALARLAAEPGATLWATELVHEAVLRLWNDAQPAWRNRWCLFAAAAETMRRILVDRARARHAEIRGGGCARVTLHCVDLVSEPEPGWMLALHNAMDELEAEDPRAARLVLLRFFGGLTIDQAAEALEISRATAVRDWWYARAWLRQRIDLDHLADGAEH